MSEEIILALDYGGTKLSAAITTPGSREWLDLARVPSHRDLPSPPNKDARYDQDTMRDLARKLLNGRRPMAIGISFGGPVDAARGVVILSHHVPGWENVPLRDQLQTEFGVPVQVDNDANVAALGEYRFGAGMGCASLLYVTVSTGVGGGWVLDGKIFHGADAMAGEIGHTFVAEPREGFAKYPAAIAEGQTFARLPLCICGRRGCVEVRASGPAIAREARERLSARNDRTGAIGPSPRPSVPQTSGSRESSKTPSSEILSEANGAASGEAERDKSSLRAFAPDRLNQLTAADVARAANAGDELAQDILDRAAHALGFGIGTAITLINPERVLIGGGVSKSGERWWRVVRQAARVNTLPQTRVDIAQAALGDDAPLWGAVALVS